MSESEASGGTAPEEEEPRDAVGEDERLAEELDDPAAASALRAAALADIRGGKTASVFARATASATLAMALDVAAIRAQGEKSVSVQQAAAKTASKIARKARR